MDFESLENELQQIKLDQKKFRSMLQKLAQREQEILLLMDNLQTRNKGTLNTPVDTTDISSNTIDSFANFSLDYNSKSDKERRRSTLGSLSDSNITFGNEPLSTEHLPSLGMSPDTYILRPHESRNRSHTTIRAVDQIKGFTKGVENLLFAKKEKDNKDKKLRDLEEDQHPTPTTPTFRTQEHVRPVDTSNINSNNTNGNNNNSLNHSNPQTMGKTHKFFRDMVTTFSPRRETLRKQPSLRNTVQFEKNSQTSEITLEIFKDKKVTTEIFNWERINQSGWKKQDAKNFSFEGYSKVRLKTHDIKPLYSVVGPNLLGKNERGIPISLEQPEGVDKIRFYCRSISTYPIIPPDTDSRSGDPICDSYYVALQKKSIILALADGCNWGVHVRQASLAAAEGFVKGVLKNGNFKDLVSGGQVLLQAVASAHNSIFTGKNPDDQIGTTTLLGGTIVQFEDRKKRSQEGLPTHGFLCASIGDCKAYHWSRKLKEVTEVTAGNRGNTLDATDCGGRLGPVTEDSEPDLRNLDLYFQPCDIGDFIFIVSDGVHDNFDCQTLGKQPNDFNLPFNTWTEANQGNTKQVQQIKSRYSCQLFEETIKKICATQSLTPKNFGDTVLNYCNQTTQSSREFMQIYTDKKLPSDYSTYPGKMDHTTIICVEVLSEYKKN